MKRSCVQCEREMKLGVAIQNTNIAYLEITNGKLYGNDPRLLGVCDNPECANYGVVQIPMELLKGMDRRDK